MLTFWRLNNMKDNKDGTVTYSIDEFNAINNLLNRVYDSVSKYIDNKEE